METSTQTERIKRKQKIFILGSINIDNFYSVDHIPRKSETIQMKFMHSALGGKGFNQAICLAHYYQGFTQKPEFFFIGAVGNDNSAEKHLQGNF